MPLLREPTRNFVAAGYRSGCADRYFCDAVREEEPLDPIPWDQYKKIKVKSTPWGILNNLIHSSFHVRRAED